MNEYGYPDIVQLEPRNCDKCHKIEKQTVSFNIRNSQSYSWVTLCIDCLNTLRHKIEVSS